MIAKTIDITFDVKHGVTHKWRVTTVRFIGIPIYITKVRIG